MGDILCAPCGIMFENWRNEGISDTTRGMEKLGTHICINYEIYAQVRLEEWKNEEYAQVRLEEWRNEQRTIVQIMRYMLKFLTLHILK